MPKVVKALADLAVRRLKSQGLYTVGGVTGLKLQVSSTGARSWILRVTIAGKVRDIGLGSYPLVTLKSAREHASLLHESILRGEDPIAMKKKSAAKLVKERAGMRTFDEVTALYIESAEAGWSNKKSRQQWENTISTYASPVIGRMFVSEIDISHVVRVLDPIWSTKTETASRLRGRIERVLAFATTRGFRSGDNPARYKGHLDNILPSPEKLKNVQHHPALDYEEIGLFMSRLKLVKSTAARALEFLVLTAARSGEVRGATWAEIDVKNKLWTLPSSRMKAGKQHVIPLNDLALSILTALPRVAGIDLIFPAIRQGALSDATLGNVIRTLHTNAVNAGSAGFMDKHAGGRVVTCHGFRSTFRDWAAEQTAFPREVIEHCLAHQLKDKAEAAYQRKTSVPKREKLMQNWADYSKCAADRGGSVTIIQALARD
jgi:integrase